MEVRANSVWINLLDGPYCSDVIDKRCTSPVADATGTVRLFDADGLGNAAGVAMCGGVALTFSTGAGPSCSRTVSLTLGDSTGFAFCYSGRGELFFRNAVDANTACAATGSPSSDLTWQSSCSVTPQQDFSPVTFSDGASADLTEGAVLMLNRYEQGGRCGSGNAIDVMRLIKLPTNGAPFSELSI